MKYENCKRETHVKRFNQETVDTESTDAQILDDFNKIKSDEISRKTQKNSG